MIKRFFRWPPRSTGRRKRYPMFDSREIFGDLKAAPYFSFYHFPDTIDAQIFCNSIIEEILAVEERKRKRRAFDRDKFNKATVAMLCRLLGVNDVDNRRWVFRSLREETFTSSSIKGETFIKVISVLDALNYVQVVKGGNHRNPFIKRVNRNTMPVLPQDLVLRINLSAKPALLESTSYTIAATSRKDLT